MVAILKFGAKHLSSWIVSEQNTYLVESWALADERLHSERKCSIALLALTLLDMPQGTMSLDQSVEKFTYCLNLVIFLTGIHALKYLTI